MVRKVSARMQAQVASGKGDSSPREDPMSKYPEGCTLAIEGIPFHASESIFLPALVACFGKWDVPNAKVIAVNIFRLANRHSGTGGTYVNTGHMFIRFSDAEFMKEVKDHIMKMNVCVTCNVTGNSRRLRCRLAHRDLGGKGYYKDGSILERTKYFDDCFRTMEL